MIYFGKPEELNEAIQEFKASRMLAGVWLSEPARQARAIIANPAWMRDKCQRVSHPKR